MASLIRQALAEEAADGALSELSERALSYYQTTLKGRLEPEHNGEGLAIHPDTGDYAVAPTPTQAGHLLFERHPEGGTVTLRIGLMPDYSLAARLLA